jgi:hypothetical protein
MFSSDRFTQALGKEYKRKASRDLSLEDRKGPTDPKRGQVAGCL